MTESTIPGDLGMRGNTAQDLSLDGVQRTRAEHASAAREGESRNGKCRDQSGNDASPCETP